MNSLEQSESANRRSPAPCLETRWKSCALWPDNEVTNDKHDTEAQANEACQILKREGMGCLQEIFPVAAWVEPPTNL